MGRATARRISSTIYQSWLCHLSSCAQKGSFPGRRAKPLTIRKPLLNTGRSSTAGWLLSTVFALACEVCCHGKIRFCHLWKAKLSHTRTSGIPSTMRIIAPTHSFGSAAYTPRVVLGPVPGYSAENDTWPTNMLTLVDARAGKDLYQKFYFEMPVIENKFEAPSGPEP